MPDVDPELMQLAKSMWGIMEDHKDVVLPSDGKPMFVVALLQVHGQRLLEKATTKFERAEDFDLLCSAMVERAGNRIIDGVFAVASGVMMESQTGTLGDRAAEVKELLKEHVEQVGDAIIPEMHETELTKRYGLTCIGATRACDERLTFMAKAKHVPVMGGMGWEIGSPQICRGKASVTLSTKRDAFADLEALVRRPR